MSDPAVTLDEMIAEARQTVDDWDRFLRIGLPATVAPNINARRADICRAILANLEAQRRPPTDLTPIDGA